MLIVVRAIQALLLLAALACAIGGVVVVGAIVNDTEDACYITEDDKASVGCATVPNSQAQATVGVTYALTAIAMMGGAIALNGMARPVGNSASRAQHAGPPTGPFPQPSGPFAPPPQQPPLHPGQSQQPY